LQVLYRLLRVGEFLLFKLSLKKSKSKVPNNYKLLKRFM